MAVELGGCIAAVQVRGGRHPQVVCDRDLRHPTLDGVERRARGRPVVGPDRRPQPRQDRRLGGELGHVIEVGRPLAARRADGGRDRQRHREPRHRRALDRRIGLRRDRDPRELRDRQHDRPAADQPALEELSPRELHPHAPPFPLARDGWTLLEPGGESSPKFSQTGNRRATGRTGGIRTETARPQRNSNPTMAGSRTDQALRCSPLGWASREFVGGPARADA
jgi:hypothetical protein